jgi:hypothetical protein
MIATRGQRGEQGEHARGERASVSKEAHAGRLARFVKTSPL